MWYQFWCITSNDCVVVLCVIYDFLLCPKLLVVSGAGRGKPDLVVAESWMHVVRSGCPRVHACSWICTRAVTLRPWPLCYNCMEKHHARLGWVIAPPASCYCIQKMCFFFFFVNLVPAFFTDHIHNFRKQTTNNLNSPYDYTSVMHYGRWGKIILCYAMFCWGLTTIYLMYVWCRYAFSEDGGPTIIPRPDPYIPIGQRDGPSALDLHKINVLYNCGRWT